MTQNLANGAAGVFGAFAPQESNFGESQIQNSVSTISPFTPELTAQSSLHRSERQQNIQSSNTSNAKMSSPSSISRPGSANHFRLNSNNQRNNSSNQINQYKHSPLAPSSVSKSDGLLKSKRSSLAPSPLNPKVTAQPQMDFKQNPSGSKPGSVSQCVTEAWIKEDIRKLSSTLKVLPFYSGLQEVSLFYWLFKILKR